MHRGHPTQNFEMKNILYTKHIITALRSFSENTRALVYFLHRDESAPLAELTLFRTGGAPEAPPYGFFLSVA